MLETVIKSEGENSIAAFILEPISINVGSITYQPEYLPTIRDICNRHNVLLIYDEIITSIGRTGDWFAAQTFNVTPDLLCTGKGLSSGYAPLFAVAIRDDLYFSTFWGEDEANISFATGHTYGGNPISAAAGLAVIEVMEHENLIENGRKVGAYLRERLEQEVGNLGVLGEVRGIGCMAHVEFVEDMATNKSFPEERQFGKRVEQRLMDAGLILRCQPHWISFAPPLITTLDQVEEMIDIFVKCLREETESSG